MPATAFAPQQRSLRDFVRSKSLRGRLVGEKLAEYFLLACGLLSIAVTVLIVWILVEGTAMFLLWDQQQTPGAPPGRWLAASEVWDRVKEFFTGDTWSAVFNDPEYGILPLLVGTLMVAVIAALIAVPIGLSTAIYLSEYAHPKVRAIAKPALELLAGIPTVVYGFFAVAILTPDFLVVMFRWFGIEIGNPYNQLSGGIVVGIMIIPMVASLSEDAIRAVPRSLREGAIALGANKFETSTKVVVPAALSGITASFVLAFSRAIGETMAVSLACGEGSVPLSASSLNPLQGYATMTSFIVRVAKGNVVHGSTDYYSLYAVAATLFIITLTMNFSAQLVLRKFRQVYQ